MNGARIAWLVWRDAEDEQPEIFFTEPDRWHHKIIQIVYFEIQEAQ